MHVAQAGYPFVDLALARRLERTEAHANASSVEARARLWPSSAAAWIEVGGAYAMFDGVDSPLTQTFGLGLFDEITGTHLDTLERFFAQRGAPNFHEVSPLAHPSLVALLNERGYRPLEFTSVMFRPLGARPERRAGTTSGVGHDGAQEVRVREVGDEEQETWSRTASEGWSEYAEVAAFMRDIGRLTMARADATCFLAELEGRPVATGVLSVHEGVALLAGASTVPSSRGRGAQLALLDARLGFAAEHGCDLAMMCAAPGSASQRNAERHGFRIAYTRLKWRR